MGLFKAIFGGSSGTRTSDSQGTPVRRNYDASSINDCIREIRWVREMAERRLFRGSSVPISEWPDAYRRVFINAIDTLLNRRERLSNKVYDLEYYLGEVDELGRPNGYGVYAYAWRDKDYDHLYKYKFCDWSHGQCNDNGYILHLSSNDANDWFRSQGDGFNPDSQYTIVANKRTYR